MTQYERRKHMNEYAMKLNKFRKEKVKELREKGLSIKDISLILDVSEMFVINVLNGELKVIRKS